MKHYPMLIRGQMVEGDRAPVRIINPANSEAFATAANSSEQEIDQAVLAAREAFQKWKETTVTERQRLIGEIAKLIQQHAQELIEMLVRETGKPLAVAQYEVQLAVENLQAHCQMQLETEVLEASNSHRVEIQYRPLGVVAGIVPWNFPLFLSIPKLASALLAGNAIILKNAVTTPLTWARMGELLQSLVPVGLVNIVSGDDAIGPWLTAHPGVDKISFTGSVATGKQVMAGAGSDIKRLTLELGGNDAAIVLPDVDIAQVAPQLLQGAFINSGQICIGIKRLYVHESIYEPMLKVLAAMAEQIVVGDGLDPETAMGPIQNETQYNKVLAVLEGVRNSAVRIVAGGTIPDGSGPEGKGYFLRPTIVADVQEGCELVDEETFGPILPVIKYTDVNDAIARANNTTYGLGGSVWGSDEKLARAVAEKLECGIAWVNQVQHLAPHIPMIGTKHSGLGMDAGLEGLKGYAQAHIVDIAITDRSLAPDDMRETPAVGEHCH